MDPRRLLIAAACALLSSCAFLKPTPPVALVQHQVETTAVEPAAGPDRIASAAPMAGSEAAPGSIDAPPIFSASVPSEPVDAVTETQAPGPVSYDATVEEVRAPAGDHNVGGVQVFTWTPGRIFPVRTAPLRVTTLSFSPGEFLVAKAAGDTVRWQIGEVKSGAGADERSHVVLKPFQRGLETNLILTTNRRIYHVDLSSGPASSYDAAIAWDAAAVTPIEPEPAAPAEMALVQTPAPTVALPEGEPDGRYRIEAGRNIRWTPTAVFNDGRRTFITFNPDMQTDEAPILFLIAPNGERQLVNYRQAGGLFVVDRVVDRAELRLGDRRPQVVSIRRIAGEPA